MAKRSKQYSFHLNLNNPDHLKIYRTLEDLNTDIHKSVSNFVIMTSIRKTIRGSAYLPVRQILLISCLWIGRGTEDFFLFSAM